MKRITLDGTTWRSANDFYDAFFEAVGAPEWHGRNLNALNDSIGAGSINQIDVPYSLHITGLSSMSGEARSFLDQFRDLVEDLRTEGVEIELNCID